MDSLLIKGGVPLHGDVTISGAKNAVLPIMAATLLTSEPCVIRRVPKLSDVRFMGQILAWLGAQVKQDGDSVRIHAKKVQGAGEYDLIRKMRGSICIMGPLLGRLKKATVSLPAAASSARGPSTCISKASSLSALKSLSKAATSTPPPSASSATRCSSLPARA